MPTGVSNRSYDSNVLDAALREAALRLAWYVKAYGGIPSAELNKLMIVAHGLRDDTEAVEMLAEARSIRTYLLEICERQP